MADGPGSRRRRAADHPVVRVTLTAEGDRHLRALAETHLEELSRTGPRLSALWSHLPQGSS